MQSPTPQDRIFLQRCLELARMGQASVEPNPRVGAVVVYDGLIIGEGYHKKYGSPHAEVNAIAAVKQSNLLAKSTLYVSLEPCNHHGKTPPCSLLILHSKIPRVVVGCTDPNPQMSGSSLDLLRQRGVEVVLNDDPAPFLDLLKHFTINQKQQRPYITLKWAESQDGFIAKTDENGMGVRTTISGPETGTLTHRLRAEHASILVGANTVLVDQPSLLTRNFPGPDPIKILLDDQLKVPNSHPFFKSGKVLVVNELKEGEIKNVTWIKASSKGSDEEWLNRLYSEQKIGSILVEGGASVLNDFLSHKPVDEIFRIVGPDTLGSGIPAPDTAELPAMQTSWKSGDDQIHHWKHSASELEGK